MSSQNSFLLRNKEKAEFNQYWYSTHTIESVVDEIETCLAPYVQCETLESPSSEAQEDDLYYCAFLSTPSIHFSLRNKSIFEKSLLLDFDKAFERKCKNCMFFPYDFNRPEDIPSEYKGKFRYIIADPPFITREVWEQYAVVIKYLASENAKILCSTIVENQQVMKELLNCTPLKFKPSIPHLVYQYLFYTNYDPEGALKNANEEIPED